MLSQNRIGYSARVHLIFSTSHPPLKAPHPALPPRRNFLHVLENVAQTEVRAEAGHNFAK